MYIKPQTLPNSVTNIGVGAFFEADCITSVIIPKSVTSIGDSAFLWCDSLINVYYNGTEEEWENISIGSYNTKVKNAIRYYYIENQEDVPTDGGNYWHYDENGNIAVW
mgnify:CR=1 FL=1